MGINGDNGAPPVGGAPFADSTHPSQKGRHPPPCSEICQPDHEANPTELIDIIMLVFDVFMMTILFFIVLALKRENAPRVSDPSWISYTGYNYGGWTDRGFNIALGLLNDNV